MKILLIAPPFAKKKEGSLETYPPLGIMQLSAYLKQNGVATKILDFSHQDIFEKELKAAVLEFDPDAVGISSIIASYKNSIRVVKTVKKINRKIRIVLGGIYPTFGDEKILRENPEIDVIVRGEGELTLTELLNTWRENTDINKVEGISFMKGGEIIQTKDRPLIADLDILPAPDYSDLTTIDYYLKKGKFLMVTSRGCPYRCTFCSTSNYWRHNWRAKNANKTVTEFEQLCKLGAKNILVGDDLFIPDKKRVIDICRGIIDRKLKVTWRCSCRANLVDLEILDWLKKAGCDSIFIGGESGNQETLNKIDKHQKVEEIIRAREWCRKAGIKLVISFIMGFPWETKEEIRDTINLAKKIEAEETAWFIFHTDIGSPIYKAREREAADSYDPDKCLDAFGSGTKTKYVNAKELEGLYLEAILATS